MALPGFGDVLDWVQDPVGARDWFQEVFTQLSEGATGVATAKAAVKKARDAADKAAAAKKKKREDANTALVLALGALLLMGD